MKILSSDMEMNCTSFKTQRMEKNENLDFWVTEENLINTGLNKADTIEISEQAKLLYEESVALNKVEDSEEIEFQISEKEKQKILLLESFIEKITGKKIKFQYIKKITINESDNHEKKVGNKENSNQQQGWGLRYSYNESYYENEKISFNANGCIKTEDGRSIDLSLQLNMSREFASHIGVEIKAGDALIDPIVINYDGKGTELTQEKFIFDLDTDGTKDEISFVKPGSGLLALDKNNDGIINDGSELFGPQTGNGFVELKKYDVDHNNWIDENDPIFDKLKIWIKDENGNDELLAIGKKGIGAIYLGNVQSSFDLKDEQNDLLGQVKKTGIFLNENGTAGTVQEIDLVI